MTTNDTDITFSVKVSPIGPDAMIVYCVCIEGQVSKNDQAKCQDTRWTGPTEEIM